MEIKDRIAMMGAKVANHIKDNREKTMMITILAASGMAGASLVDVAINDFEGIDRMKYFTTGALAVVSGLASCESFLKNPLEHLRLQLNRGSSNGLKEKYFEVERSEGLKAAVQMLEAHFHTEFMRNIRNYDRPFDRQQVESVADLINLDPRNQSVSLSLNPNYAMTHHGFLDVKERDENRLINDPLLS